jgi:pimeloyl-ACP methyl ester carboxylesterase
MSERLVPVSERIELWCESHGDPAAPMVLLVMGLGLDLCWWRDDFVAQLADLGLHVVRFDNRDVGRSTHVRGPGVSAGQFLRRRANPSYTLAEMADDAAGLIAALTGGRDGVRACVVGASMGAMIAQELAIRHPDRVGSLVSIMGRPGDGRTGKVAWRMFPQFLRSGPADPEGATEHLVKSFHSIGSVDRTAQDDEDVRVTFRRALQRERGDGTGAGRQLAAILAERDRTADLRALAMPATVIHGTGDRVITPSGGRATAAAIPGAELVEIDGMGHDLPRWVWPRVQEAIVRTVARTDQAARGSSR